MIRSLALAPLALIAAPAVAQTSTDVVVMRRVVTAPRPAAAAPAASAAVVVNGGLDTLSGWSVVDGNVTAETGRGRSKSTSAMLGYRNGAIGQSIKTVPGETYVATAYFSMVSGSAASYIQLANTSAVFKGAYAYKEMGGVSAWTPLSVTFKATQDTTYLLIEVINHTGTGDRMAVDDVSVVKQ